MAFGQMNWKHYQSEIIQDKYYKIKADKNLILFILQNAYQSDKHQFKNDDEWSRELANSHTGRRLKEMIPDGAEYKVINSSGMIGDCPDSCYNADLIHIQKHIDKIKPIVICACGKIAQRGCKELGLSFIAAPHPAWRQLSKQQSNYIKGQLREIINLPLTNL